MSKVHINIGSNRGNTRANIERAVMMIARRWPNALLTRAPEVHSKAWGYESEHKYVNLGIMLQFDTRPDPEETLGALLQIERSISPLPHRGSDGNYCDREIDIDLIAIDDLVVDSATLTLPHPRMLQRPFVMEPLRYLDPEWQHPLIHQ